MRSKKVIWKRLEVAELRMFRWSCRVTRLDRTSKKGRFVKKILANILEFSQFFQPTCVDFFHHWHYFEVGIFCAIFIDTKYLLPFSIFENFFIKYLDEFYKKQKKKNQFESMLPFSPIVI